MHAIQKTKTVRVAAEPRKEHKKCDTTRWMITQMARQDQQRGLRLRGDDES